MSEWKEYKLGDIVRFSSGGTPSKANEAFWGGNIPWISASSMEGYSYSDSTLRITEFGLKNGSRIAPKNSILLLVRGSILHQKLQVGIVENDVSFNQDVKCLQPNEEIIDPWFLLFWFKAEEKNLLNKVESTGIGAGKLDTRVLQNLIIRVPPKNEREKLNTIFKSIQKKIELNRQMNQTLEAMAQALFKSWFVDFDPVMDNALAAGQEIPDELQAMAKKRRVIANRAVIARDNVIASGARKSVQLNSKRLINTNSELAGLFPSSFEYNETLGKWIPEGWEVKSLDKIANYQNGLALQKFRPESDTADFLPVLKISHLKDGKTDGKEKARRDLKSEYIVEDGDVIFSWSASLFVDVWCGGKAALNQHLFKVTSKNFPKWFYYLFTKHHLDEFIRIAADKAVTKGHIKKEHLSEAKCVFMSSRVMSQISSHFENLISKQIDNRLETESLTQLRDKLLPELISGKFRVENVILNQDFSRK